MATEYNILTSDVPVTGVAVANINTLDSGAADDMASLRCVWKDHNGTSLSDLTWAGSTVTGAESSSIVDTSGTGTYQAKITIPSSYTPPVSGHTFTLTVTATDDVGEGAGSQSTTFTFKVVPSSLSINLDSSAIVNVLKRQAGLTKDIPKHCGTNASATISLGGHPIIYGIDAAYKNGVAITQGAGATQYAWVEGRPTVVLGTAPSDNDFFLFRVQTRLSTTAINDYIDTSTRYVVSALYPFYEASSLATQPTVYNMIADHALGRIKEDLSEGVALDSAFYRSGHDAKRGVEEFIRRIQRGQAAILKSDGSELARKAGSIVGSGDIANEIDEVTTRQELRQRLAEWDNVSICFWPLVATTSR